MEERAELPDPAHPNIVGTMNIKLLNVVVSSLVIDTR